jgi:tetratricopeptide (TPR) repeat protein
MKLVVVIFFILFFQKLFGQIVEKTIAIETCSCIEQADSKNLNIPFEKTIEACLKESIMKRKAEIATFFDIQDTTDYAKGYSLGKEMSPKIFSVMIKECDRFYHYFDSLRQPRTKSLDQIEIKKNISILTERLNNDENLAELYFARGMAYFLLGFDEAEIDFKKALELNKTLGLVYLYQGWIKEIQQNFPGAKSDYQKCLELTGNTNLLVLISIVERKERDSKKKLIVRLEKHDLFFSCSPSIYTDHVEANILNLNIDLLLIQQISHRPVHQHEHQCESK